LLTMIVAAVLMASYYYWGSVEAKS